MKEMDAGLDPVNIEIRIEHHSMHQSASIIPRDMPPLPFRRGGYTIRLTMKGTPARSRLRLFSGSLYGLCLSGVRTLGAVTPLGGVAFIAGWLALAYGAWTGR